MKSIKPRTPGEDWLDAQRGQHHAAGEGGTIGNRAERRRVLSFERRTPKAKALEIIQEGADTLAELGIDLSKVAPHLAGLFGQKPLTVDPTKRGVSPEVWAQLETMKQADPDGFKAALDDFVEAAVAKATADVDESSRELAMRIARRELSGILGDGTEVDGRAAIVVHEREG